MGNLAALEYICDTGIDLEGLTDNQGFSPLTLAAKLHKDTLTNYISLRFNKLDNEDPEGLTIFSRYILKNSFDLATKFMQRGCNVNYQNRDKRTPLTLAILRGNEDAVKYLLGKGADPHYEDLTGKDSCDYALKSDIFKYYSVF